jgi:hypothetical protein
MARNVETVEDVEVAMKRASLAVSLTSVVLMAGGLLWHLEQAGLASWPGDAAIPFSGLTHLRRFSGPVMAMSAGVVLLAILPALRVLLALGIYGRRRKAVDFAVALLVMIELLASMFGTGA